VRRRRRLKRTTFVGITGSVGKTTTKRLTGAVVASLGGVVASKGSHNQRTSVARTLLRTHGRHRTCVVELGAGGRRPFPELLELLRPQVGVVTSVGWDHYSQYRGLEGVAREKVALVRCLPPTGVAVLNADDPYVRRMAEETQARVLFFGLSEHADVRGEGVRARWPERLSFVVTHGGKRLEVKTRLLGEHSVHTALAALATGIAVGVPLEDGVAALAETEPEPHRMSEVRLASGITFVQDDWKAPAWTMPAALEFLGGALAERRIAIVGQVSDDPRRPRRLYADLAREARAHAEIVVLVGEWAHHGLRARAQPDDSSIMAFQTAAEANGYLEQLLRPGDLVLVKGSGTLDHLERLVLARSRTVRCWRHRCGRMLYCERCSLLAVPGKGPPRLPGGDDLEVPPAGASDDAQE
jgi:UDP-N-acetylmuramyl pentapeptide synthase